MSPFHPKQAFASLLRISVFGDRAKSACMDETVARPPAALGSTVLRGKAAEPGFVRRHAIDGSGDIAAQTGQRVCELRLRHEFGRGMIAARDRALTEHHLDPAVDA